MAKTNKAKTAPKAAAKKKPAAKTAAKAPVKKTAKPAAKAKAAPAKKTAPVKPVIKKTVSKPVKAVAKSAPVKAPVAKATPAKTVAKAPVAKVAVKAPAPKAIVAAPAKPILPVGNKTTTVAAAAQQAAQVAAVPKKPEKLDFTAGDFVVYPAHGVGYVEGVETQVIAGMEITLYTITFEKDRMRLKLPVSKVKASGLRKLSSKDRLKDALSTLQGRSQTKRIMWSRRAQEYEAKINSGDPVAIAEVLRDLRKDNDQSEQSYSERQIYQAALERLAREVAAIEKIDEKKAAEKLEAVLGHVA